MLVGLHRQLRGPRPHLPPPDVRPGHSGSGLLCPKIAGVATCMQSPIPPAGGEAHGPVVIRCAAASPGRVAARAPIGSSLMGWSGCAHALSASRLAGGTKRKEHAMSETHNSVIAVIGIDIGKNSFHVFCRSAIAPRPSRPTFAWPGGDTVRQHASLPDRHGGLCRSPSSQPPAQLAWPRCSADAGEVRPRLLEGAEERLPRRGGDRRGGPAPDDEVRGHEDRRSIGPAGAAPAQVGQPAYRCHQSDPRLPLGAWGRGAARATLLACRVARH